MKDRGRAHCTFLNQSMVKITSEDDFQLTLRLFWEVCEIRVLTALTSSYTSCAIIRIFRVFGIYRSVEGQPKWDFNWNILAFLWWTKVFTEFYLYCCRTLTFDRREDRSNVVDRPRSVINIIKLIAMHETDHHQVLFYAMRGHHRQHRQFTFAIYIWIILFHKSETALHNSIVVCRVRTAA